MHNRKISDHFEKKLLHKNRWEMLQIKCKICAKSLPFYSVLEYNYFSWLLNLSQVDVTNLKN